MNMILTLTSNVSTICYIPPVTSIQNTVPCVINVVSLCLSSEAQKVVVANMLGSPEVLYLNICTCKGPGSFSRLLALSLDEYGSM